MNEEDTEILHDMWSYLKAMSKRLDDMGQGLVRVEAKVDQLSTKLDRTDLLLDRHLLQNAEDFARVQSRIDDLKESALASVRELRTETNRHFERIEARLDAVDGRLITATVALHELKLREAT